MLFEEKHSKTNYYTTLEYDNILCISHCQSSFEILFVTEGCVNTVFSDKKVRVNEGECIWVLPYEIHNYETPENSKVFIAIFSADYLKRVEFRYKKRYANADNHISYKQP